MRLPEARGALTSRLREVLRTDPDATAPPPHEGAHEAPDADLALWVLHELHYRGFDDVDDAWEWHPALAPLRHRLESGLEARLRARWPGPAAYEHLGVADALQAMIDDHDGPSMARHVQRHASRAQVESLLRQRSLYHLKEADPTSWAVARLEAGPKAALLQVQYDEYGAGDPERLHHAMFARGLADSGIDATYGAHVDEARPEVLEQNDALSLFGLRRSLRGAALGHLAVFEATSSLPSRQMAQGLRRLGFAESMAAYYDEHVEADAVHEQLVLHDVCERLVAEEPALRDDVLLGGWSCLDLETRTAGALLADWSDLEPDEAVAS
ncbi:iron-containing redox enzyme family protein [Nocardioides marmoraquaticus]